MSEIKRIFKNTAFLFVSHVINIILSFILVVAIARYLGDEGLGKYSFAFAFAGLLSLFSDLGELDFVLREVSKNKKLTERYINNLAGLNLCLGVVSIVIPSLIILIAREPLHVVYIVMLASIATFFINYNKVYFVIFRSYEVMEYESVSTIIERFIALILGLAVLMKGYGIVALLLVLTASNIAKFFFSHFITKQKISNIKLSFDKDLWNFLVKNGIPFWFTGLFMNIYFRVDTVMLGFMTNYAVVGWYNAAYKVIDMLGRIPFIATAALFPVMSRLFVSSKDTLRKIFQKSYYYLFVLAVPIGIGGMLLADRIILFAFKSQFKESVIALQILIWAVVFMFVNYLIGFLLNSINKQKLFTLTTGIGALFNVILNFALIPYYSFKGAAFATVLTEALIFILLYYFAAKNGYNINLFAISIKPIIAGIFMGIFLIYFSYLHILLLVPLAAIFYFAVLLVIRGFSKEEYEIISVILKRPKED